MAKFRFFQDKEVKTWVRDYFNVEAETLDEAIEYVKNMGCSFDEDENRKGTKVEFEERDSENSYDLTESAYPEKYGIYSVDLDDNGVDAEVVCHYGE